MKFGIYTLVIENTLKDIPGCNFGWGTGYVLLPYNHPFYNIYHEDIDIYAHGGLTYSNKFSNILFNEINVEIGGDVTRQNFDKFNNYWMIGFDTNHYNDTLINCSKHYVLSEAESLIDQCLDDSIVGLIKYKNFYLRKDKLKYLNSIMP